VKRCFHAAIYVKTSFNANLISGESDSVYRQNQLQGEFYRILQKKGMYINQPDTYFFQGGTKTGNSLARSGTRPLRLSLIIAATKTL